MAKSNTPYKPYKETPMKKAHCFPLSRFLLWVMIAAFANPTLLWADESVEIKFGITPWKTSDELYRMHKPLMNYLEKELKTKVSFNVTKDYSDLLEQIKLKRIDIGSFSPNAYVEAKSALPGLKYIVTPQEKDANGKLQPYYQGVIIVLKSSSIHSLNDLKGKTFGFTDTQSTSGYIFPRNLMQKEGINPDTDFSEIFMLKKHNKVTAAVVNHSVDGGATAKAHFQEAVKEYGDIFRVIAETPPIPYDAYAAGPHVSSDMCEALKKALLALTPESPVIQEMKKNAFEKDAFIALDDHLYDVIREVNKQIKK